MTLVFTLVGLAVALTALLLGVAIVLQGYLYNQPADRLPLRAAVGGLALACFLTFWAYLNTRASHPDKYGTLFEFTPDTTVDVTEFEAVRRTAYKDAAGKPKEVTVPYKWQPGARGGQFTDADTKSFLRNSADFMTIALMVPDGGQKVRFDADMEGNTYTKRGDNDPVTFREAGGSRYITDENLHHMYVPSKGALMAALAVNLGHFLVWVVVFWAVVRFNLGHSLALTALFGLTTMFVLMPMLFQANAVKVIPA